MNVAHEEQHREAPSRVTAADLVIADLADSEARLRARVFDLEGERDAYRELLTLTLDQLGSLTAKHERTQDALRRLLEAARATKGHNEAQAA